MRSSLINCGAPRCRGETSIDREELREPKALVEGSHPPLGLCLMLVKNTSLTHFLAFFIRVFTFFGFFASIFFSFAAATFSIAFFQGVALAEVFTAFVAGFNFGFLAAFLFTPAITFGFAAALGLVAAMAFLPWELPPSTKEKKCHLPTSPPSSYVKGGHPLLGLCLTPFWAREASKGQRRRGSRDLATAIDLPLFTGEPPLAGTSGELRHVPSTVGSGLIAVPPLPRCLRAAIARRPPRSKLFSTSVASSPVSPASTSPNDDAEKAKLAQVAKRLENTSRYFRWLGNLGFWGQLVCTVVAAVILSFFVVITGKVTSPATFYATAGGIAAALISVFWSFGYIRLSEKLRKTANDPSKAPPRADVVKSLKNDITLNLLGMSAAILGMQATVGLLVAKFLTSSVNPY
ncbi:hypothetical protein NL676_015694 [Syzygium grande]|nr:hypothetical protein NL676_015694 [Syzygium grande]